MLLDRIGHIEKVASQEDSRFCLRHLYFDAEHGRLCATNGHALIVCECKPEPGEVTGLISVEAIQQYRKFRKENRLPNMVKFHALKDKLVVEDLVDGKVFSFRRPEGSFPQYANIIPQIPKGTPPSVSFNPKALLELAEAFPTEEYGGKGSESVSIWLLPDHAGRTKEQFDEAKQKGQPLSSVPAILVRTHHSGGMAILMGQNYAIGEENWSTELPSGVEQKEKKAASSKTEADKKPAVSVHPQTPVEKVSRTM
jgi:hypothetical protein